MTIQQQKKPTSQISEHHPYFHGPIARIAAKKDTKEILLTLHEQEPTEREKKNGVYAQPPVSWSVPGTNQAGPLSLFSFLCIYAQDIQQIGHTSLRCHIESPETLASHPFITRHTSGFYQLVHFDLESREFSRQILYITDDIPSSSP